MPRLVLSLLATAAFLTFDPPFVQACDCMRPGAPCEELARADAVFVGRVVSIGALDSQVLTRRVEFAVHEGFRGVDSLTTVITGAGGGDCGYPFKAGETYVVYAHRSNGVLSTGLCTRTRPLAGAAEDVKYGRSVADVPAGAATEIKGKVYVWKPSGPQSTPATIVTVAAIGEDGNKVSTFTNSAGEYRLFGLTHGKYDVRAEPGEGYEGTSRIVHAFDPRGCGTHDLWIKAVPR